MDKKRKGYSWVIMYKFLMVSGKSKELYIWVLLVVKEWFFGIYFVFEYRIIGRFFSFKFIICFVVEWFG